MQLKRKLGVLQKVAFELRYRHGYSYLDKCERTVDALMDAAKRVGAERRDDEQMGHPPIRAFP